jgi:putative membrane protein
VEYLQPPIVAAGLAALLYLLGGLRVAGARERRERGRRAACFFGGLALLVAVLAPPFDRLADSLFAAHMVQHIVLLEVVPPLLVLAHPWNRLWRPFPLGLRRTVARGVALAPEAAPLRAFGRVLSAPLVAFALMNGALVVWHVPVLFDAALASQPIHDLEHATFFVGAMLLWAHLLGGGPFRARLTLPHRVAFAIGSMIVGWVLAVVLATTPSPLSSDYAALASRPLGLTALEDQHLAAGIMWVPGSIPWTVIALVCAYGWLDPSARRRRWVRGLAGEH